MTLTGIRQFKALLAHKLNNIYPETEIDQLGKLALQDVLNVSPTQLMLVSDSLNENQANRLLEITERLAHSEPLQYILGYTEFYDLKMKVSPAVLIPRPETEELVHWILNDTNINTTHILDIGTGSGCIPLALKHHLPDAQIEAWDVSIEALSIARENAENLRLDIQLKQMDILQCKTLEQNYTCIVSNPPYVRHLEKDQMEANVLQYEPHLALFVDNEDPLIFYRTIATLAWNALIPNGALFFEINEYLEEQMNSLLAEIGYINLECRKDLQGKARMMKATRP